MQHKCTCRADSVETASILALVSSDNVTILPGLSSMAPNSGAASFCDSTIAERLRCLLQNAKKTSTAATILLVGPSGSGKSALVRTSLLSTGFQICSLDFRQLCHDDSTTSIAAVAAAFRSNEEGMPAAVILDDLDFWAPASDFLNTVSATDIRTIAALSDALARVTESFEAFAFIATACDERAVHPALRYPGRFAHVLRLSPLSVLERTSLAKAWLCHAFASNTKRDHDDVDHVAAHIATVTPGFVHADLRRLFSALEQQSRNNCVENVRALPTSPAQLLSMPQFWDTIKSVTPSLLKAAVGSSALSWERASTITGNSLHGLDSAIQRFRECLTTVFSVSTAGDLASKDPHIATTVNALQALGTFRGLILHGPTGCGKTAIARLAPSILSQRTVNFLTADASSIVSSVIGEAERKLTQLFSVASAIAPALLVVENIDVLAPNRDSPAADGGSAAEAFNRLLSTFLTQIDGVQRRNEEVSVFVIATTRSLKLIDPALLRPGRFEMHIEVCPPDAKARVRILEAFLKARDVQLREGLGKTMRFSFDKFEVYSNGWTAPDVLAFGREMLIDEKLGDTLISIFPG